MSAFTARRMAKDAKGAAAAANARAEAEKKALLDAQAGASMQAQERLNQRRRAMSQTVYTSPFGFSGEASMARKSLLGG